MVSKSETSKCAPDTSIKTRKYPKGLDGGLMGPQKSPCNLWSLGGRSVGNFHWDSRMITFLYEHVAQIPTLLASMGLRPLAVVHAGAGDSRLSNSVMGFNDGDTIKHPNGFVFFVISPTKVALCHGRLGHHGTIMFQVLATCVGISSSQDAPTCPNMPCHNPTLVGMRYQFCYGTQTPPINGKTKDDPLSSFELSLIPKGTPSLIHLHL